MQRRRDLETFGYPRDGSFDSLCTRRRDKENEVIRRETRKNYSILDGVDIP